MKQYESLALAVLLICGILTGCVGETVPTEPTESTAAKPATEVTTEPIDRNEPSKAVTEQIETMTATEPTGPITEATEPPAETAEASDEPITKSTEAATQPAVKPTEPENAKATESTGSADNSGNGSKTCDHPTFDVSRISATCTGAGAEMHTCSICGYLMESIPIPAQGHNWGDWETVTEQTDTAAGTRKHTCRSCGMSETEDFHACACSKVITKEATCTEEGSFDMVCNICGKVCWSDKISALGHEIVNLGQVLLVREFAICPHCNLYLSELGSMVYLHYGIDGEYIMLSSCPCDPNDALYDHIMETDGSFANHSWANDVESVTIVGSRTKCTRCGLVSIYDCGKDAFVPVDGANDAPDHFSWRCGYCGTEHSTKEVEEFFPKP